MGRPPKLKDPAEEKAKERQVKVLDDKMKSFDIGRLSMEDFKAIPRGAAKSPHPFDGYPRRPDIQIGEYKNKPVMVNPTHIIGLNPTIYVHQDPAGQGLSQMYKGKERHVDIPTLHNRMVRDMESGGTNLDVVFGIKLGLANGEVMATVLPSPSGRAQIMFRLNDQTGKVEVDERYLLLDQAQAKPLQRLFLMIHNQAVATERLAAAISDEVDEATAKTTLETTPATSAEE